MLSHKQADMEWFYTILGITFWILSFSTFLVVENHHNVFTFSTSQ